MKPPTSSELEAAISAVSEIGNVEFGEGTKATILESDKLAHLLAEILAYHDIRFLALAAENRELRCALYSTLSLGLTLGLKLGETRTETALLENLFDKAGE